MDDTPSVDTALLFGHLWRMLAAFALALPVGWNRERKDRTAGLRTFPLVALASCGYLLLARSFISDDPDAQARILQGLITGIGFVGGGAILKNEDGTKGTATAASIWSMGAVGASVAVDRFEIAIVLSFLNFAIFWLLPIAKEQSDE